jgi:hypothetical protein
MSWSDHDKVNPAWEPIPWDAKGLIVEEQKAGFYLRSLKLIAWTKVDWNSFPECVIFGHDRDWFIRHDVAYVATFDNEDLILIRNTWFGFPDPPEWGLATRSAGDSAASWMMWGHFPVLPSIWEVPDVD